MDINELQSYRLGDAVKFNDKLNHKLWGQDEHLLPEVREKLLAIAQDFKEFLGIDLEVRDITISGSNAAYTYTPHSDIDLHLVADLPRGDSDEVYRELFDAKKYQYNDEHDYKIGGYDVELYVQNANEPHHSQGIYSVLNNDWVRVPSRRKPTVDDISVRSKYEDIGRRIDSAIESGDRERMDAMGRKIRDMRQAGLDTHGEFGPENLAFKVLRGNGTLQRLRDARLAAKDQEMSLKERSRVRYGFKKSVTDEDYDPNEEPPGPESKPEMPAGTVLVNVSDVYDWYKLGQDISDLPHANPAAYGKGAPQTILSFGSEPVEHMYKKNLDRLGLKTLDIDRNAKVRDPEGAYRMDEDQDMSSVLKDFVAFVVDRLGIEHAPKIKIKRDPAWSERNNTFGRYVPEEDTLYVSVANRHVLDVLRTIAHELTHHRQEEVSPMPPESGETGSPWEDEANALAGRIMRDFGAQNPDLFGSDDIDEGLKTKLAALGTAACIAGAPGCATTTPRDVAQGVQTVGRTAQTFKGMKADDAREELTTALKDLLRRGTGTRESRVDEASGYIPTAAEKDDPRYKMALTVDVHPGETGRQANKLGLKTDSQGRPQLLMKKLGNLLESVKTESEDLFEVKMSPSELERWAKSPEAEGIQAGFEAEMIFRDTQREDHDGDMEPDYDPDTRPDDIDDVINFFSYDEYGYGLSPRAAGRVRDGLYEEYHTWMDEAIEDEWRSVVEEQVADYMEQNVWEDEQDQYRERAAEELGIETSEESAEQSEKIEARARELFDEDVQQEIEDRGRYYDEARDYFSDMMRDNGDYDEGEFLRSQYGYMSDIGNAYNLDWPYWYGSENNGGGRTPDDIAHSLAGVVDGEVKVGSGYHGVTRRPNRWIIEPDGSLDPDESEDAGLEIVSPPMPLPRALEQLQKVIDWGNDEADAYTNSSTGLHMGVSIPHKGGDVDYVKLILFMGDQYVLDRFGRASNTYCRSALEKLKSRVSSARERGELDEAAGQAKMGDALELIKKNLIELAHRYVQGDVGTGKYTSAHIKPGYIEFRSPGGDYLSMADRGEYDDIKNTMLRFARAMQIAGRPDLERKEYAKKLTKLLTQDGKSDSLRLFSDYVSGKINQEELKKQWAAEVLRKEQPAAGGIKEYEVVIDGTGEVVGTLRARNDVDADAQFRARYRDDPRWFQMDLQQKTTPLEPEPEKKPSRRAQIAKKIATRPTVWHVEDTTDSRVLLIAAKTVEGAKLQAQRQDPEFNLLASYNPDKIVIKPATAKEIQQYLEQRKDDAQDSQDIEQRLTGGQKRYRVSWREQHGNTTIDDSLNIDAANADAAMDNVRTALAAQGRTVIRISADPANDTPWRAPRSPEIAAQAGRQQEYQIYNPETNMPVVAFMAASDAAAYERIEQYRQQHPGIRVGLRNAPVPGSTQDLAQRRAQQTSNVPAGVAGVVWEIRDANGRLLTSVRGIGSQRETAERYARNWLDDNNYPADTQFTVAPLLPQQARQTVEIYNPRTGEVLSTAYNATQEEIDAKIRELEQERGVGAGLFRTRPAEQSGEQPRQSIYTGQWTGRWLVKDRQGNTVYTFGGVGNNQADANRTAHTWLLSQGDRFDDQGPFDVVPEIGQGN